MDIKEVYSYALDAEDFLRASGELFAQTDSAWKAIKNAGEPLGDSMKDFAEAGIAHLEALDFCGLHLESLLANVSILISLDIVKADIDDSIRADLYKRLLVGSVKLKQACRGDSYAESHIKAILGQVAGLYLIECGVHPVTDDEKNKKFDKSMTEGLLEACRAVATEGMSVSEMLVDIFSRLHALAS